MAICLTASNVFSQSIKEDPTNFLFQKWTETFRNYKEIRLSYRWTHRGPKINIPKDAPKTDANSEDIVYNFTFIYDSPKFDYRFLSPAGEETATYKFDGTHYQDLSPRLDLKVTNERLKLEPFYPYEYDCALAVAHRFMLPGGEPHGISDLSDLKTWLNANEKITYEGEGEFNGFKTIKLTVQGKTRKLKVEVCPELNYLPLSWSETTPEGGDIGRVTKVYRKEAEGKVLVIPVQVTIEGISNNGEKDGYVDTLAVNESSIIIGEKQASEQFTVAVSRATLIRDLDMEDGVKDKQGESLDSPSPSSDKRNTK